MGKIDLWTQTILRADTLGLVLRVFVTAANVGEREGGKRYSNESTRWVHQSLVCMTIWVDGGFDGEPFMRWVMDVCRWIVQVVLRPKQTKGFVLLKTLGSRAHWRRWALGDWWETMSYFQNHRTFIYLPRSGHGDQALLVWIWPLKNFSNISKKGISGNWNLYEAREEEAGVSILKKGLNWTLG